jgi:hypothetical protein
MRSTITAAWLAAFALLGPPLALADDDAGIELAGPNGLSAWAAPTEEWQVVGSVEIDPKNPRLLASSPGDGLIVNGPAGKTRNLVSKESFGDVEARIEFLIPRGSNSGVKFMGLYEIQIADSAGKKSPTASDCGGIYPRAELGPPYRYIDAGFPPKLNAARPAGEWQTLDVTFLAPRFDAQGKKTADARFARVSLNGQVIHQDLPIRYPTGHAWHDKEVPTGPLLLQADHGPVAFRSVTVKRLKDDAKAGRDEGRRQGR